MRSTGLRRSIWPSCDFLRRLLCQNSATHPVRKRQSPDEPLALPLPDSGKVLLLGDAYRSAMAADLRESARVAIGAADCPVAGAAPALAFLAADRTKRHRHVRSDVSAERIGVQFESGVTR